MRIRHVENYQELRKAKYPPPEVLADALYWASKGDNSKLEAYYLACDRVKEEIPKPTAT